jgi:hypothetical protein
MPLATSDVGADTFSQMSATALMKLIFVARKALLAYLIISALNTSVMSIGRFERGVQLKQRHGDALRRGADDDAVGVKRVSAMAEPSRRNSGFETTSNSTLRRLFFSMISRTKSPVPTGTVDLFTMIL